MNNSIKNRHFLDRELWPLATPSVPHSVLIQLSYLFAITVTDSGPSSIRTEKATGRLRGALHFGKQSIRLFLERKSKIEI